MPVDFTGYNPAPPILPPPTASAPRPPPLNHGAPSPTSAHLDPRHAGSVTTGDAWRAKIITPTSIAERSSRLDPALGGETLGQDGDKDEKRARLLREMEAMREALKAKEREMSEL